MTVQSIQSDYGNATVTYSRKAISSRESYQQIFEQKLSQLDEVIRNGSTEKAIPLGGAEFTSKEWEEMLANFDVTMEDMREQMREAHEKAYEEQLQEEFSTSKYDVVSNDEYGCFEVYNGSGERVGVFFYSDINIKLDANTGTQLLISEHGTDAYDAMLLDQELIWGFQEAMGVDQLEQSELEGFSLYRHKDTDIQYLVKDGDEGRGGRLLINSEEDLAEIDELAENYLREYPDLVSNKEVAQINAVLEVLGLMERTPYGIVSINCDGMAYNDNYIPDRNWTVLYDGEHYNKVSEFVKLHRVLGTDMSDNTMWSRFFEENNISIYESA